MDNPPPAPLFPAGKAGQFETRDFDELAVFPTHWHQQYRQVEAGQFSGGMIVAHTARVQFGTVHFDRGITVDGLPPPASCSLMLFEAGHESMRVRGRPVHPTELVGYFPDVELDAVFPHGCLFMAVSVDQSLLQDHVEAMCGRPLSELIRASRGHIGAHGAAIAQRLRGFQDLALSRPEMLSDPSQVGWIEEGLMDALLEPLAAPVTRIPSHKHATLARQVRDFLHEHAQQPMRLSELCRAVGVPERTLHLIFMEAFGMPPKAYLKMIRLNGARRDLLEAGPNDSVSGVAVRWGFLHFGWFSVDYHHLFGERPSDTLARVRPRRR